MTPASPLIPDWSTWMSRAQEALKRAEKSFLLADYEHGVNDLGEAQEAFNKVVDWIIAHDTQRVRKAVTR
jgi:hypothetical protein